MRVAALVASIAAPDADHGAWVEAFALVIGRADDADSDVLETVAQAIADAALPYAVRESLYRAAIERDRRALARLFLTASPTVVPPEQIEKALAPERPLRPNGKPLSLGERKALARTHKREQLLLLLRDPHPAVVAILLDNPHVTESDIVRIASARPAVPESLSRVAIHGRWSVRHAIKRAVVLNPATPLADAIRMATTLPASERAALAADVSLPDLLRQHLAEL
ncbi:MAG TPA: hypothetical protein VHZ95_21510 [Polyangiales bacterium]|nr:hypothetical protein [Polyangiales bacterium]